MTHYIRLERAHTTRYWSGARWTDSSLDVKLYAEKSEAIRIARSLRMKGTDKLFVIQVGSMGSTTFHIET